MEENLAPDLASTSSPSPVADHTSASEEDTLATTSTPMEDTLAPEPASGSTLVGETLAQKDSIPSLTIADPLINPEGALVTEDITLEENNEISDISEENKTPTKIHTEEVITSSQKKKRKKRAAQEKKDEEKRRQALHDVAVKTPLKDDEGMDRDTTDKSNPVKVAPIFRSQMQTPAKPRTTTRTSKIALKK